MYASVIIPVWNGEAVIADCLQAIYEHTSPALLEVICVDNASRDSSASLISERFPQVLLLEQPVNLGFAGGVNQGIEAAKGDAFILLNQDCLVAENWLPPLLSTFLDNEENGILGATIFNADGSTNHVGAYVRLPDAWGVHETVSPDPDSPAPRQVDYVTGALFAIRRSVWEKIGAFDEGFYPAYYEEADYCYRARRHGFKILHVPETRAKHYFSSTEWRTHPIRHAAIQHFSRYRFVAKHFMEDQLKAFVNAEAAAISTQAYLEQIVGALLGLRDALIELPATHAARERDLGLPVTGIRNRTLKVYFGQLLRGAYTAAQQHIGGESSSIEASRKRLAELQEEENQVLARLYFRHPTDTAPESYTRRWWRLFVLRALSIVTLRDYRLLARLNTLHAAYLAQLQRHSELVEAETAKRLSLFNLLSTPLIYDSH